MEPNSTCGGGNGRPIGEPGRFEGVQPDEKGLAHCSRGSGEAGGRAGAAGHAKTGVCDARGPRYAASQELGVRNARRTVGALVRGEEEERTEGLAGASSADCARERGARLGEQWVMHWHCSGHAGGISGIMQKGTRRQGERACGRRRTRAPDTTLSPRLRASARFPFPGRRPIATAAPLGARCWRLARNRRTAAAEGRKRRTVRELLLLTGGRESPRAGFSGRTGAGGGDLAGGRSKRRSILATVPAAPALPACPPHRCPVQRTHSGATYRAPLLRSPATTPMPPPPLPLVSDCPVPCHVMVHPEYAYSSALLWADLP
jgi:hypothetical protein